MLLEVEDLHVHFGQLAALRGISLNVEQGEIVSIVGPNGAGKSTTLLSISSVLKPSSGKVTFDGKVITGMKAEAVARLGISQVPEGRHIFSTLTVEENLRVATSLRKDRAKIKSDFDRVFDIFPILAERRRQTAGKLSGGEQQMLAIGRALLTSARLMTIDEPSLGLAPKIVDRVYEVLRDLRERQGLTLLIVEQSSARALKAADRLYVLRNGEMRLEGATKDLRGGDAVHQAYFGFAEDAAASGKAGS